MTELLHRRQPYHHHSVAFQFTFPASLSSPFLQTLQQLVTPLKGQSQLQALVYDILPSLEEGAGKRCSECGALPNSKHWFTTSFWKEMLGVWGTPYLRLSVSRNHPCKHAVSAGKRCLCGYKLATIWAPTKKLLVSWQFSETCGVRSVSVSVHLFSAA